MQLGNKAYKQKPSRWLTNNTEKLVSEVYLRLSNLNQSMACSSKQEKTNMLLLLLHMCTNIQQQPAGCLGRETRCTVCHMGQVRSRILQLSRPGGSIQGESCRGVRRDQLSSYQARVPCCRAASRIVVCTWGRRNYLEQRTGQGEHDGCTYLLYSTVQLNNP